MPLAGITAYRALFSRGRLRGGETVLVQGAGSGALDDGDPARRTRGSARARHLVLGREDRARGRARRGGRRALHPTRAGFDEIRALAGGNGVDLALHSPGTLGGFPQQRCGPEAASSSSARPSAPAVAPGRPFYFGQYSILGTTMGSPGDMAGLPAHGEPRQLASGHRLGAPARRRGRGAPPHRSRARSSGSSYWRSQADGPRPPPPLERSLPAARSRASRSSRSSSSCRSTTSRSTSLQTARSTSATPSTWAWSNYSDAVSHLRRALHPLAEVRRGSRRSPRS